METAATSTQGTFVGIAISPDDFGTFGAVVLQTPLDEPSPLVNGGEFAIDGQLRNLEGLISDGEIVRLSGSCSRETFNVTGHVILFQNGIPTGEFGHASLRGSARFR